MNETDPCTQHIDHLLAQCDALQATLDAVTALAETYCRQWHHSQEPKTFDQGVGALAQDILDVLSGDKHE